MSETVLDLAHDGTDETARQTGDETVEAATFPVRLRDRGQMTLPQAVRDRLDWSDGDQLTVVEIGDIVLLTKHMPRVAEMADRIVELMAQGGVTLADMLQGLAEEREAIAAERRR